VRKQSAALAREIQDGATRGGRKRAAVAPLAAARR